MAPVPSESPWTVKVTVSNGQTLSIEAVTESGIIEILLTITENATLAPESAGQKVVVPKTVISPEMAVSVTSTCIIFVFEPDIILNPSGTFQW